MWTRFIDEKQDDIVLNRNILWSIKHIRAMHSHRDERDRFTGTYDCIVDRVITEEVDGKKVVKNFEVPKGFKEVKIK